MLGIFGRCGCNAGGKHSVSPRELNVVMSESIMGEKHRH